MVVWYIGAPGTGKGNPYGVTAALVSILSRHEIAKTNDSRQLVFLAPFLFMRILAPIQSMALWLMTGVTITVSRAGLPSTHR